MKVIAPLERPAERTGPGLWHVPDLPLAVAGTWRIDVEVLISYFDRQTTAGEPIFS